MFTQLKSRQISFAFLAVLLALSTLLLITTITWAKPAGIIIVTPGQSVQAAIDAATSGDTIVINPGTYTESLTLSKPVSLTGVSSAKVIINAVPNDRVLTVTGSQIDSSVVISGMTLTGGRMYYGAGIYIVNNAQPLIRNMSLQNNFAASLADDASGGGIFSHNSLVLIDVDFINNSANGNGGGGLYIADAGTTTVLTRCRFINNSGFSRGGAIYSAGSLKLFETDILTNMAGNLAGSFGGGVYASSAVEVYGGRFENNVGGGLFGDLVAVSNTRFISNSAPGYGGGLRGTTVVAVNSVFERNTAAYSGGGISAGSLMLTNSLVISNSAIWEGCGVQAGSAAISGGAFIGNQCLITGGWTNWGIGGGLNASGILTLTNVDFIDNSAQTGGAIYAGSMATVVGSRFERNSSLNPYTGQGGGMTASTLVMTGVKFISNTAPYRGGGLYVSTAGNVRIVNALFADNTTSGNGAALWLYAGEGTSVLNVTIASASLNPKQGIYIFGGTTNVTNTIVSNHAVGLERENSYYAGVVSEDYNIFFNNTENLNGTISNGSHDPMGNPNFVDPARNNYHLGFDSAAIDAGVNVGIFTDLDGHVRPVKSGFDIGAYENQYTGPIYYVYLPLIRR